MGAFSKQGVLGDKLLCVRYLRDAGGKGADSGRPYSREGIRCETRVI